MPRELSREERREFFDRHKVRVLTAVSFVLGFLDAFFLYIISSYFAEVAGENRVNGFYLVAFILVLLLLMNLQPFIQRYGKARILLIFAALLIFISFAIGLGGITLWGAGLIVLFLIGNTGLWVMLDIILEDYSTDRVSGRIRGLYLTIINAGFLLSPLLSTRTLAEYGYEGVFTILLIGYALVFVVFLTTLSRHHTIPQPKISFREALVRLIQTKDLLRIFHISLTLEFFYAVMIIYTPIHLISLGYSWSELGLVFTLMLLPFVFLQYPLGLLADTQYGEKELLFVSLLLMAGSTAWLGFLGKETLFFWGGVLFLTRIGAAAIEILRDSYFYKRIDGRHADLVAVFRMARPLANVALAMVAFPLLYFFSLPVLFLIVAAVIALALYSTWFLGDSESEREKGKVLSQ